MVVAELTDTPPLQEFIHRRLSWRAKGGSPPVTSAAGSGRHALQNATGTQGLGQRRTATEMAPACAVSTIGLMVIFVPR